MVGSEATGKDITMVLDLNGHPPDVQRSLVIHEFGHALGLEHEHQRSDFWDVLGKHFDYDKMKSDPRMKGFDSEDDGGAGFEREWFNKVKVTDESIKESPPTSEYDSKSIMHYW